MNGLAGPGEESGEAGAQPVCELGEEGVLLNLPPGLSPSTATCVAGASISHLVSQLLPYYHLPPFSIQQPQ